MTTKQNLVDLIDRLIYYRCAEIDDGGALERYHATAELRAGLQKLSIRELRQLKDLLGLHY